MRRGPEFLARLREHVLVGDGALGTVLAERAPGRGTPCERLNQTHPDLVRSLHAEYLDAGAGLVTTNTFGANRTKVEGPAVVALNGLGVRIAREAAGTRAFVAGSVGPLAAPASHADGPLTDDQVREVFREQVVALADAGADLLLLETFTDLPQLLLALEVAKRHAPDLPAVCQLAFHERGHTPGGVSAPTALEALVAAGADVVGANCGRGVRAVVLAAVQLARSGDALVSAFPNAGLPAYVDGRYLFGAPLPYLADAAEEMANAGVNLIGGCCGTTPAYVRAVAERVHGRIPAVRIRVTATIAAPAVPAEPIPTPQGPPPGSILEGLGEPDRKPLIVVELDPPHGLNFEPIVRRAKQLRDMGVDAITMADNPVAKLHMGNLALAKIVQDEADVPVILHLACRDHNLLGLQSRLMEAHVFGVHHVLALTGDPAKVGDSPGATSVYDLNSIGLVELISRFNAGRTHADAPLGRPTRFAVGVAYNPNGKPRSVAAQADKLRRKARAGAHFAMTQPVYDAAAYLQTLPAVADLTLPVFVGIMPLLSERNAEYLHNEVPGIHLPDETRRRMKGLKGEPGRRVGLDICRELIDALADTADGFYLIPPQSRTEMAVELVDHIRRHRPRSR